MNGVRCPTASVNSFLTYRQVSQNAVLPPVPTRLLLSLVNADCADRYM